ncbi:DNA repair protein RadA [Alphaproteobacteria bacterium HT1-32]|nr:DNA repair protein RadA [Alphaproteobacteria bacterium HT1-32]|tara:strand:+ start:14966 stop:16366 length:1401 start_codon:yes stop_codon:yes gene_type:complete
MKKSASRYVCQECGASTTRWAGRCDGCGAWNSIVEEAVPETVPKGLGKTKGRRINLVPLSGASATEPRRPTGISELDRVSGGGLVPGSAILIGGDPGIGKSTLLLQAAAQASRNSRAIYISGEEAIDQIRMRAFRLGLSDAPLELAAATNVRDIIATLQEGPAPSVVIIDSIQTMFLDNLDSAPGTVAQVRSSAAELVRIAKRVGFALFLVGHVTKDGGIAGPRVLEHMVDTVMYFEGDRSHQFRILRAVKNRFGPTDEIGVFEMSEGGLGEVANPSEIFLGDRDSKVSGACVFAGMEGSRPVLVEIQALVASSSLGTPRRAVVGWDSGRLAMILAVLEARCGLALGGCDVYLNVAGGYRISEPAADLAVAAALVSAQADCAMPERTVVFGEIGLGGEVRAVGRADARLREAAKLGFERAVTPDMKKNKVKSTDGIALETVSHVADLVASIAQRAGGLRQSESDYE